MTNRRALRRTRGCRAMRHWTALAASLISLAMCSCHALPTESTAPTTGDRSPSQAAVTPATLTDATATATSPATVTSPALAQRTDRLPNHRNDTAGIESGRNPSRPVTTGDARTQPPRNIATVSAVLPYEVPTPRVAAMGRPWCPPGQYGPNGGPAVACPTPLPLPCPAPSVYPQTTGQRCPDPNGPCVSPRGAWIPPGLNAPWPDDEYLCDGGDKGTAVHVQKDWSIKGLGLEDTVAHYDTVDGQTRVEPSNCVCIYAPRFAAVRKVYGLLEHETHQYAGGVEQPLHPVGSAGVRVATTTVQPVQPILNRGTNSPIGFRERQPAITVENLEAVTGAHGGLLPFEDFTIIRDGKMDNSEKARLAQWLEAAVTWSHDKAVQVLIDDIVAIESSGIGQAASVHTYELQGKGRLRICKLASRQDARPGDIVEFTLRFDNVGDQMIGNVTVIDNLTTRLEYVEKSQTCTVKAGFSSAANQGDSLTLRWEIEDPLKVGEGGVIRFKCRVR